MRVYGPAKQGAAFGPAKIQGKSLLVRGLNVLAATVCTPLAAPVIAATRLRGGNAASARGAASMITEGVSTARAAGCTGTLVVRMDSAFYGAPAVQAARTAGARFSVTVRMDPKVRAAIAAIGDDAWTPIRYPRAIWDDQLRRWVSDAEVAEAEYTAFTSRKGQEITARLIVRRVRDLSPQGQAELFPIWRYHAVSQTPRSRRSRLKPTTAATPRPSRSSPTGPTGRWPTCRRAPFPPTPPGWRSRPSPVTCCAPPARWPASPTPKPAVPPSAATSLTSQHASPGTAAGTSPCTCPKAGTASTSG
jgi:hypothetical protein